RYPVTRTASLPACPVRARPPSASSEPAMRPSRPPIVCARPIRIGGWWRQPAAAVEARKEMTMTTPEEPRPIIPVRFAVLAVSDSRSLEDDRSGATLAERIVGAGHVLADRSIVTDDEKKIRRIVKKWVADPEIDVVITTGGTGFTGRDVTPDAVEALFDKHMDGFSTVFH